MKVRELIRLLKKMPQDARVGQKSHDNSSHEIAGWAETVVLFDKSDPYYALPDYDQGRLARQDYASLPDLAVVISG